MIMVRKHNILTVAACALAIAGGTLIGVTKYRYDERQRKYHAEVQREALKFKICPDKLRAGWGSCAAHDQRVKMRDKADRLAKEGKFLEAGQYYIEVGDWISARTMAGRLKKAGRTEDADKLKYVLKLRKDSIDEALRQAKKEGH